jgi:nitrogen fixation/metabolism regulation signal transduction histidine kinase
MTAKSYKRSRKLIEPVLQLKLVCIFVALAACSIVLQALILSVDLRNVAQSLPAGSELEAQIPHILNRMLLFSAGMWLPVTLAVGIVVTHRIAGPIYRFKQHLNAVANGEVTGKCRIRKKDELQELCHSINRALKTAFASVPLEEETTQQEAPAEEEGERKSSEDDTVLIQLEKHVDGQGKVA